MYLQNSYTYIYNYCGLQNVYFLLHYLTTLDNIFLYYLINTNHYQQIKKTGFQLKIMYKWTIKTK